MRGRNQAGFTLIEVLIAVVIFAVGLLTVASLQIVARKATYDAVQRTTATHLSQGMLERMRANRRVLNFYTGGDVLVLGGGNRLVEPANKCQETVCDSFGMASADLWEWEQLLFGSYELASDESEVGGLVSPTACISGPVGALAGVYAVSIAWRGVTALPEPAGEPCGRDNAAYDAPEAGRTFRRVVTISTFINAL